MIVLIPHLIWLNNNEFITIKYALARTGLEQSSLFDHIWFPLIFIGKQIGIIIPFFILIWLLIKKIKLKINLKDKKLFFLLSISILPITLMFLTSFIIGSKIRTMWMTPFYLFLGTLFVYLFQSQINLKNKTIYGRIYFLFLFISCALCIYFYIKRL